MGYTLIDLFSGAGGLTQGFVAAGFTPVFAVEKDPDAARTYRANFGDHVHECPIEALDRDAFPEARVIVGGPPCQGFSPLGKMNGGGTNAELNGLWREYYRVVQAVEPDIFVLENVPQFLRSAECAALRHQAKADDYEVTAGILNAVEFGVPQRRRRALVVGSRVGTPLLPERTVPTDATVGEAIERLPQPIGYGETLRSGALSAGSALHFNRRSSPRSIERYRLIPQGGNRFTLRDRAPELLPKCWRDKPTGSTDVLGRLRWGEPALTIRTEFWKPEKGRYLHPEQHRGLTHLEASLLQGFPEDYRWSGSKISVARQIGNAVPPPLANAVAAEVVSLLKGSRG